MTEYFRANTVQDHGRYRTVTPEIVVEIAFDRIQRSRSASVRVRPALPADRAHPHRQVPRADRRSRCGRGAVRGTGQRPILLATGAARGDGTDRGYRQRRGIRPGRRRCLATAPCVLGRPLAFAIGPASIARTMSAFGDDISSRVVLAGPARRLHHRLLVSPARSAPLRPGGRHPQPAQRDAHPSGPRNHFRVATIPRPRSRLNTSTCPSTRSCSASPRLMARLDPRCGSPSGAVKAQLAVPPFRFTGMCTSPWAAARSTACSTPWTDSWP